ncbi:DUF2637 domain-containing protein [Mycolicibacter sinensis]|uniref:DUF2637 domain-containing protein n=1 Tax=Mycolicibacter sinensis (strain JDM601) TaxID=875328 RepID=A0A1A2XVR0_MYCSD|nr:DUF2637 domain-containing protein [Mycolicibacter sinensis]OBI29829.1 hypothetical protein A5710_20765 [Mycolicibacter sinensis]
MSRLTAIELEAETDRAKARRFFMGWLIAATVVSVGGNAARAVLEWLPVVGVKIVVACLPPVVALIGIHGVAVLARSGHTARARASATGGWVYSLSVAVTGLLALGAAVLSFAGLHSLAVAGGINAQLAPIWPICIDAGIAVSTVALVVLRPASAADLRAARAAAASGPPAGARANSAAPAPAERTAPVPAPTHRPRTASAHAVHTGSAPHHRPADKASQHAVLSPPAGVDPGMAALARTLVDTGATTKTVEQVQQVLAAHATGAAITRIAANTGMHHKTVRTIINAAAEHRQLASVG